MSVAQYNQHLSVFDGLALSLMPISFQAFHECSESFSLWWHSYYFAHLVDEIKQHFVPSRPMHFLLCKVNPRKPKVCTSKRYKLVIPQFLT